MELSSTKGVFKITDKVKQTRVGAHVTPLVFLSYPEDDKLCIITHLKEYIKRANHFRNYSKHLLNRINMLARIPPPNGANESWLLLVLMFQCLKVADNNASIKDIMLSAGWSNEKTFRQYYQCYEDQNYF